MEEHVTVYDAVRLYMFVLLCWQMLKEHLHAQSFIVDSCQAACKELFDSLFKDCSFAQSMTCSDIGGYPNYRVYTLEDHWVNPFFGNSLKWIGYVRTCLMDFESKTKRKVAMSSDIYWFMLILASKTDGTNKWWFHWCNSHFNTQTFTAASGLAAGA